MCPSASCNGRYGLHYCCDYSRCCGLNTSGCADTTDCNGGCSRGNSCSGWHSNDRGCMRSGRNSAGCNDSGDKWCDTQDDSSNRSGKHDARDGSRNRAKLPRPDGSKNTDSSCDACS